MKTLDWPEAKMPKIGQNMMAMAILRNSSLNLKILAATSRQQGQIRNKAQHSQTLSLEAQGKTCSKRRRREKLALQEILISVR